MEFPVKYQVFISSTFRDLKDWRKALVEKILAAGHIPTGMEDFPAGDEEDLEVIKRAIDDCDIYVVVVGSKFGSIVRNQHKSFTQLEFQYAKDQGKAILAFLQDDMEFFEERDRLSLEDKESQQHEALKALREDVKKIRDDKHRIIGYFRKQAGVDALASRFATAIERLIGSAEFNASGWVRLPFNVATNRFTKLILERISDFETLSERCTQAKPNLKQAMAEHFWYQFRSAIVHSNTRDIFFESGSTIAFVASAFRAYLESEAGREARSEWRLSTNNMITYLEFVLHEHIQIDLAPHGPPENKYGATFGSLTKLEEQRHPITNVPLSKVDRKSVAAVKELAKNIVPLKPEALVSDGKSREPALIVATASGLELTDKNEFLGPHVGSYYNKLFKRAILLSEHPVVLFLDEEKIAPGGEKGKFKPGHCHPVCDPGLTWEKVCDEFPLAICVGIEDKNGIENIKKLLCDGYGFQVKEIPRQYATGWAIVLENECFRERFCKRTNTPSQK